MMKNFSLRSKILFTTVSIVTVTIGVILILIANISNATADKVASSAREHTDLLLRKTLYEDSKGLSIFSELISSQPGTKSVIQADFVTISDYLQDVSDRSSVDWVYLIQGDKLIGSSKNSPVTLGSNFAGSRPIKIAMDGQIWKGIDTTSSVPTIMSAAPVRVGSYIQAVVVVGKNIDNQYLSELGNIVGAKLVLDLPQTSRSNQEITQWISKVKAEGYVGDLLVHASFSNEAITEQFSPLKSALLFLFFGAIFASIVLAASVSVSITKPIDELVKVANLIRTGTWPKPFSSLRRDEIGILQNSFDQMTHEMQSNLSRLESMLHIDPLTEALNHRAFRERLEQEANKATQFGFDYGLILLDIDNFESYNLSNGVSEGDLLLKRIANFIETNTPETSILGRHGGDEFIIYLAGDQVESVADWLRIALNVEFEITVSMGCAAVSEQIYTPEVMILAAAMAKSQAKVAGKNRVRRLRDLPEVSDINDVKALLSQGSYSAVRALAEAVDAKDQYTRGHSQRVAEYARDLAKYCGHDDGFVELVFVTGTLHDVGKIGVPDEALKKPGKLTDEEFDSIKLHPALGEKIVSQIPQLADTLPGIRNHHERFDGRGYPDKLAGENISLLARILAIADTYDAMTSDRPYRKGLDVDFALSEIEKGAGTQFDPEMAMKFVELLRKRDINKVA